VLTTFFDVAYQSYLPTIVRSEELLEARQAHGELLSREFGTFSAAVAGALLTAPGDPIDAPSFLRRLAAEHPRAGAGAVAADGAAERASR
jgi:hypothetical protein